MSDSLMGSVAAGCGPAARGPEVRRRPRYALATWAVRSSTRSSGHNWPTCSANLVPAHRLEKSSADCVGAARQYSGTAGGVALCQVAVTLTYTTGRGHALIGRALYLPGGCAADEEHRELGGVPEKVMFAATPIM